MNIEQRAVLLLTAGYGAGMVSERLLNKKAWTRSDVLSTVLLAGMAVGGVMAALLWP